MQFVVVNKSLHTIFEFLAKNWARSLESGTQKFISHVQGMRIPSGDGTTKKGEDEAEGEASPNIKNSALKAEPKKWA